SQRSDDVLILERFLVMGPGEDPQDLVDVADEIGALAMGQDRHDLGDRLVGLHALDEVFQRDLMLESTALEGLLEGVDVALEDGLPEGANVGHVHEDERALAAGRLASERPEEMRLPRPAAP